jgi:hypothetical protein
MRITRWPSHITTPRSPAETSNTTSGDATRRSSGRSASRTRNRSPVARYTHSPGHGGGLRPAYIKNCPPGGSFRPLSHRSHTRKNSLTWSPLTESNRRPSPYHPQLPGFTALWRGRRAAASDRQAAAVARHGRRKMCGCETRAVPGWPQGSKGPACFVPGRSARPGAGRSRPGRRSDDGQMILPRLRPDLDALLTRYCLACQANSNPLPSPRFKTKSSPITTRRALPRRRSGRTEQDDAVTRLRWPLAMNCTLVEVPLSTSGADSSTGRRSRSRVVIASGAPTARSSKAGHQRPAVTGSSPATQPPRNGRQCVHSAGATPGCLVVAEVSCRNPAPVGDLHARCPGPVTDRGGFSRQGPLLVPVIKGFVPGCGFLGILYIFCCALLRPLPSFG